MMTDWITVLRDGAHTLGVTVTPADEARFAQYLHLLLERNQQVNLTAITDPTEVAVKHFVDSLSVETVWQPRAGETALDIGTGAGFPGMPLAIRHPDIRVILNDSVRKKVDFLRDAAAALHLENVTPLWSRAETLGRDREYRARLDVVLARAVAHLAVLIEYALPLLKVGGRLLAMKGPSGEAEAAESANALALIGGAIDAVHRLTIAGAGERLLIVVRKTRPTPEQYPRDPGAAKKKPLYLDSGRSTP